FERIDVGTRVAVIGAGNTGIDVATAARRLGAESVAIIYRRGAESIPAFHYEQDLAKKDGVVFCLNTQPLEALGRMGGVCGLTCAGTLPEGKARRAEIRLIAGCELVTEADMVVKSIGQQPMADFLNSIRGLELKDARVVVDPETRQTGN